MNTLLAVSWGICLDREEIIANQEKDITLFGDVLTLTAVDWRVLVFADKFNCRASDIVQQIRHLIAFHLQIMVSEHILLCLCYYLPNALAALDRIIKSVCVCQSVS